MADNLRITAPITNNDNVGKVQQHRESANVIPNDPSKVTSRNYNDQSGQKNTLQFKWDNRSVFQKFVGEFEKTPSLSQTLQKFLLSTISHPSVDDNASPIQELLNKLANITKMNHQEIVDNLMFQQENSTKFSSQLFQILKALAKYNSSPDLKDYLGQFLKSYDGYISANATMSVILSQLRNISNRIPETYRNQLESLMSDLLLPLTNENIKPNLIMLKEKILPLLNKYVTDFNDFGETRDKISLLIHDISRLNVSSKDEVITRFNDLIGYCQYKTNISANSLNILKDLFIKTVDNPVKVKNEFLDLLISVFTASDSNNISSTGQTMLNETFKTLLLDNSVYMPFTHLFLPIQYNEHFMFSEIWIEKPDDNDLFTDDLEKPVNIYVSFEIAELGKFTMLISWKDKKINCNIEYPKKIKSDDLQIKKDIASIFSNNGFIAEKVTTSTELSDISSQIIKKVYEGKREVDVTI